jgi:peptidoglycan-N-acetylglucosamine deacetylase
MGLRLSGKGACARRPPGLGVLALGVLLTLPAAARATSLPSGGPPEAQAVARVITSAPVVALTFDACPTRLRAGFDREIFDILRREQVPATVFVSGKWMEKFWNEARELAAEPLIELGNHSYRHQYFSDMDSTRAREEIDVTDRLIAALGRTSVGFRPPFGDWAGWVTSQTSGRPVVLWDVVSGDAGGHVRAETIIEKVVSNTQPGSIVIFHINGRGPQTKKALLPIIRRLRARGLRFVRVSELLEIEGGIIVKARPSRYKKRDLPPMIPAREVLPESDDADPKSTAQRSAPPG